MMTLKGIKFGPVHQASGVTNFFGEGWWYHWPLLLLGEHFKGTVFVAKTTTLLANQGNMPLRPGTTKPKEWLPKCIMRFPKHDCGLNAVGLSGPGAEILFNKGRWQFRTEPFFISFMSNASKPKERFDEFVEFSQMTRRYLYPPNQTGQAFWSPVGLQLNFSCPNLNLDTKELVDEVLPTIEAVGKNLPFVPIVVKLSPTASVESILKIGQSDYCDGLCLFNTAPYGSLPEQIDWVKLFGSAEVSPLEKRLGKGKKGGLSGAPLFPIVVQKISELRKKGFQKAIVASGGILGPSQAAAVILAGADAISVGSIAMLHPLRLQQTIKFVNGELATKSVRKISALLGEEVLH